MVSKRLLSVALLVSILSLLFAPLAQAEIEQPSSTDAPGANRRIPLESPRLIVELESPPVVEALYGNASAAAADGSLDVNSAAAQAHQEQLQAEQAAFVSALQAAMPGAQVASYLNEAGASVAAAYQLVFNGLSIEPGMDREQARAQIERMPGVKAVYLDVPYVTQLYTSTQLINAPALWNLPAIGGQANAGAGVKVASVDGGVHKDAPMFSGAGYSYPPGYGPNGLGLTANNNGKIIVSRAYFRPWDPPAEGDENPWPGVNGTPHGVHTASIAAGNIVTNVTYAGYPVGQMSGVAPRAYVMSYRVFYASVNENESAYTTELLAALEDVVRDGADVVNNSWGSGPLSEGGEFDPIDRALLNTSRAGVFVAMSTGNAGPGLGTSDHPSADYINVAASTTSGTFASGRLNVTAPEPVDPNLQGLPFGTAAFGPPLPIGASEAVTGTFVWADTVDPGNVLGCNPFPANAFAGVIALISRGACSFSDKVWNAQQAGATFAIIYNNAGDDVLNMACATHCGEGEITIGSIFIGQSHGEAMATWATTHGPAAQLTINTVAFQLGNTPDQIINFSSRGPGVGNVLKPDIAAPGVNILAQGYTPGATGEARHLGYGQQSGTSMAAPHVAGAAALLRQIHPDWSNAYIKSALMSTAKYLDIYLADGVTPAQPLDMGAGRLDLTKAADPGVILDPPNLSFGFSPTGTHKSLSFQVISVAAAAETYNLSTLYTGDGFTMTTALPGFIISPTVITLNPGETATIEVTLDPATSAGFGDNQGYLVLDGATYDAHLPIWARIAHATPLADVLIIDNDFSDLVQTYDYLWYYTSVLDELGYSYAVWNTDDHVGQPATIPDAATLAGYRAIIYFTGDNFQPDGTFTVHTGLTQLDQDRLVEYLNGGGTLIAMGQDLAAVLGADETDPEIPNTLYVGRLGANWIQDSISQNTTPNALITPLSSAPALFQDVVVDLTRPRKLVASGELSGAEEAPPVTTGTTGSFIIRYDIDQNQLAYEVTVVPTTTTPITVTAAHIHVDPSGAIVRDLYATAGFTQPTFVTDSLTFSGIVTPSLTVTEVQQMLDGQFYVNVHTTTNPGGEVRGQIEPVARSNQPFVDEIDNVFHDGSADPAPLPGVNEGDLGSTLLLRYNGPHNLYEGAVAVANRDQPSLEWPGTDYSGRSIYTTFGLEGMSNSFNATYGLTPTTRSELVNLMLNWGWSEPAQAVISETTTPNASLLTEFTAVLSNTVAAANGPPPAPVEYRWDFGDGSPYVGPIPQPQVAHQYTVCGVYTVRVEITDTYGNVSIGSKEVDIAENCSERRFYMPLMHR
ncbi:MAG TPA: S8 family serine peptidase [Caldilineaceae bacterium]|nr:S8 family serine peptidase [Caldilineaceae bacterium]